MKGESDMSRKGRGRGIREDNGAEAGETGDSWVFKSPGRVDFRGAGPTVSVLQSLRVMN